MMKMPIDMDGSVDDAHTTLLGVEGLSYFSPDFKEYIQKERLNWSRFETDLPDYIGRCFGWVFWSQLDNSADLIKRALQKLIFKKELGNSLVQFWAATKTSEGRTLLTTQFQPFALGMTYLYDTYWRKRLCSYRMGMCREYNNSFYADAECAQEQLGLPGRVFLNQLPESTPDVKYYTLKEYPQRDLALHCEIISSWAVPVFEHSSHTCVGVLEIVSLGDNDIEYWHDKEFLGRMYDIFQEFGLRCFEEYEHCKMQYWDKNEALTAAFQELKMVYESVCIIHKLPLALTWVSCHSCNDLLQSQFQFSVLDYGKEDYDDCTYNLLAFTEVSKVCLLKKGQVTGRILPFPNLLYCSDIKQFSIVEFPLVPYARYCELGGWFTMCLQSSYTGDERYVLHFFLPKSDENYENIQIRLRLILRMMEEYFKTFKLASGQEWGEVLKVEVIDFQNGQKSHSIQMIPATRCIPSSKKGKRKTQDEEHKKAGVRIEVSLEEILKCSKMRREDAAKELKFSISTLKRVCRDFGIHRWPPRNIKDPCPYRPLLVENLGQTPQLNYDLPSNQASASVAHIKPSIQDADMVTIRATCENNTIKFRLSLWSRLVEIQQEVTKRLNLEGGTYYIKYKDEEDVLILIACDEDLQDCLHTFRSLGKSSIAVLLELIK